MVQSGIRVTRADEENGEILTRAELAEVRAMLALVRRKDGDLQRLEELIDDEPHIHEIVDGKKASVWIWRQVGALAKWIGVVIGAVAAYKAFVAGGQKP